MCVCECVYTGYVPVMCVCECVCVYLSVCVYHYSHWSIYLFIALCRSLLQVMLETLNKDGTNTKLSEMAMKVSSLSIYLSLFTVSIL